MKIVKRSFITFFLVLGFAIICTSTVFADDDFENDYYEQLDRGDREHGHHKDSPLEEMGENVGWGAAVAMAAAGILFPVRRSSKTILGHFPNAKDLYISCSRFFGKHHVLIGVLALVFSLIHGIAMFLSEGKLEGDGIVGFASALLMVIAAVLGAFLMRNKKAKNMRKAHTTLLVVAMLIGFFHIITA